MCIGRVVALSVRSVGAVMTVAVAGSVVTVAGSVVVSVRVVGR